MNTLVYKKLLKMSTDEIIHRGKKTLWNKWDRLRYPSQLKFAYSLSLPLNGHNTKNVFANKKFFTDKWEKETAVKYYKKYLPKQYERAIDTADRLLELELHYMGNIFQLVDDIDWNKDPKTGFQYQPVYYRDINTRIEEVNVRGDVKHLWEINRHQWLIDLAKAYFLTGNEAYVEKILSVIEHWIQANPYKTGFNWCSALEVGVRSMSWIWTLGFIKSSKLLSEEKFKMIIKGLYLNALYLKNNLSFYSSPYNHLAGEISGLFWITFLFSDYTGFKKQNIKTWGYIEKEFFNQFHLDGMSVEQSSFYHYFTLGFLFQDFMLYYINGKQIPQKIWKQLEKIFEFGIYLSRPDGKTPKIGDADDAKSINLSHGISWNMNTLLSLGSVLFDKPYFKHLHPKVSEELFWFLGPDGVDKFVNMQAEEPSELCKYFPESGYLIQRESWKTDANYCLVDCGNSSDGVHHDEVTSIAHGHADLFSFEICVKGEALFVDTGFGNYYHEWERHFRTSEAHNLLTVDGHSMVNTPGRMQLNYEPSFRIWNYYDDAKLNTIAGQQDGYSRIVKDEEILHNRILIYIKPKIWIIIDQLTGNKRHKINQFFHLDDLMMKYEVKKDGFYIDTGKSKVDMIFRSHPQLEFAAKTTGPNPDQGWVFDSYGVVRQAPLLYTVVEEVLPFNALMVLAPEGMVNRAIIEKEEFHLQDDILVEYNSCFAGKEKSADNRLIKISYSDGSYYQWDTDYNFSFDK